MIILYVSNDSRRDEELQKFWDSYKYSIEWKTENAGGLHTSDGAADYQTDISKKEWHLDGYLHPDDNVEVQKEVISTPANKEAYAEGETVSYKVTVLNRGNNDVLKVEVQDSLPSEHINDGTDLSQSGGTVRYDGNGTWIVDGLKYKGSVVIQYSYTVTNEDVQKGEIRNVVQTDPFGVAEVTVKTAKPDFTVEKTVEGASGADGKAAVGDTLTYTVTVTNTGNVPITKTLEDVFTVNGSVKPLELKFNGEVYDSGEFTVAVNDEATFTATYTVGTDDSELVNAATVDGKSAQVVTEVENTPAWTVEKTVSGMTGEDGKAAVGDTLTYTVTVTNTGNVSITKTLKDIFTVNGSDKALKLQLDEKPYSGGDFTVEKGKSAIFTATYTVGEKDSKLVNVAKVGDEQAEITTEVEGKPGLEAVKSVTNAPGGGFKAGEMATFDIVVENTGNTTQTNVTVTEQLAGATIVAGDGYTVNGTGQAVIAEMAPNATVTVKATYTVTQEDIDSDAELKNIALVEGDNGKEPDPEPEIPIPEEKKNPSLTATKTVTNEGTGENGKFKKGDTAEFDITVRNSGNTTQERVIVSEMEGAKIVAGEGYTIENGNAVIVEMKPGAVVVVKATYTVTQADIDSNAELKNVALVKGDNGTDPDPDPEIPIPEEDKKPGLTAEKTLTNGTNEDGSTRKFKAGETAEFDITVTNSGNTTQTNVTVTE